MYVFNTAVATATKRIAARTANDDLARSLIREIAGMGISGFHDLAEECVTFGQLQKVLSKNWLKSAKKPANEAAKRVAAANKAWDSVLLDEGSDTGSQLSMSQEMSTLSISQELSALSVSQEMCVSSASLLSSQSSKKVSFLLRGDTVTGTNISLAPALNGKVGTIKEILTTGRFLVSFSEPECIVSLKGANLTA